MTSDIVKPKSALINFGCVNANMAAFNPPEPFLEVEFEEATKYVRGKVAASGSQEDLLYLYARYAASKLR